MKIAVAIIALAMLVGFGAASICVFDTPTEEIPVRESLMDSSLAVICTGNTYMKESSVSSGAADSAHVVSAMNNVIDGSTGTTTIAANSKFNSIGSSSTLNRDATVDYTGGYGVFVSDNHLIDATAPRPYDENITPYCSTVYGGTSGIIREGGIASILEQDTAPANIRVTYGVVIGDNIESEVQTPAVGRFDTFEGTMLISGNNVNGTSIRDYYSGYSIKGRFSGDVIASRMFTYNILV